MRKINYRALKIASFDEKITAARAAFSLYCVFFIRVNRIRRQGLYRAL
jgi:hypothetical protein